MVETKHRSGVAAIVRAPLLHFLLLGGLIFWAWSLGRPGASAVYREPAREIVVSAERIAALREGWLRKRQRPPTEEEIRGLIESLVREEILSREAIALGLDRDDTIVRRRLAQKMDNMVRELLTPSDPADEELEGFLRENPDRYRRPARISFRQVYFSPDRRGESTKTDAKAALRTLIEDPAADPGKLGDAVMLPAVLELEPADLIERRFGPDFVPAIAALPTGEWAGPIASAFGLHLVRVSEMKPAELPALALIRAVVARDYGVERRESANRELYKRLREEYRIVVDEEAVRAAVVEPPR